MLQRLGIVIHALLLAASIALAGSTALAADAAPSAVDSVTQTQNALLGKLEELRPVYAEDPDRFFAEIDHSLAPFIDFDGFARGVMAKYYRRASDAQKVAFQAEFKNGLIRTYAKALLEFDNQEIVVMPGSPSKRPDRATVRVEVHGKNGTIYPVDYSVAFLDGEWKLRNVVINGINIGLQFRSQFGAYMQKYRNDIDAVIANWDVSRVESDA